MPDYHRRARILSWATVIYNTLEAILAITAGVLAGSVALYGFGLDSVVESLSGGVMIWRLSHHGRVDEKTEERIEARAVRIIGWTFFLFAAWVAWESVTGLWFHEQPQPSRFGILIALASLISMPILYVLKVRTARAMNSRSLLADSKETLACTLLSVSLLMGLWLNWRFGIWWADPAAGLIIAGFLVHEGFETLEDEEPEAL